MVYDIAVRGHLSPSVAAAFDDFELTFGPDTTVLHGEVIDRAALHGVINRIERFGLELLEQVAPARGPVAPTAFIEPLASREIALLQLLPTHLTYGEIADQMCVSVNTVKTYQKALFRKLNASKRSDVVATARQAGLLDAPA